MSEHFLVQKVNAKRFVPRQRVDFLSFIHCCPCISIVLSHTVYDSLLLIAVVNPTMTDLSLRSGTTVQFGVTQQKKQQVIVCPRCKARVMAIRRPSGMGTKLIHNDCPDCVLQAKVNDDTIDKVKSQLELLQEQYKVLAEEVDSPSNKIQYLRDEFRRVKEELSTTNGDAMLSALKERVNPLIPDMEKLIQEHVQAKIDVKVAHLEAGQVETTAVLEQLRLDFQHLSAEFLHVQGKSATAEGTMRTQLDDIMGQIEDLRNEVQQDQVHFGSADIEDVKDGFADMALEMSNFRGKLRQLKGKVVGFLSLVRRTKSLEKFYNDFEDRLENLIPRVEEHIDGVKPIWLSPDQSPAVLCKELKDVCDSTATSHSNRISIANKGGIRSIVLVMQQHSNDAAVQELSCRALRSLALDNDDNLEQIADEGGITAVVSALQCHVDHPGVQEQGCLALVNLAWSSDNQGKIAHEGGIAAVVAALQRNANVTGVQHAGCWALKILAASNDNIKITIANEGGLAAMIATLQRHPQHAVVQEQGCGAMANLASNNSIHKTIANLGGIAAAIAALQHHPQHARVQEYGGVALSYISISCPSEVQQAGGVAVLQKARPFVASTWVHCIDSALSRMSGEA